MKSKKKPLQKIAEHMKKGALREKAAKMGGIDKKTGNIKKSFLKEHEDAPGALGKEVRLAETFEKHRPKKHHKKGESMDEYAARRRRERG